MPDIILEALIPVIISVIASTGFWSWIMSRNIKKNGHTKLLLGLAHDRIMSLGEEYIIRGYITFDEYDNLYNYLYIPYKSAGGNGTAEKIMNDVNKLQIRSKE